MMLLLIVVSSFLMYWTWARSTFVKRAIRSYTQISDPVVLHKMQNDHEWYGDVEISETAGRAFFGRHQWRQGFQASNALSGRYYSPAALNDCSACWFYIDDQHRGPYGYVVYVLSTNLQNLQVYEVFGG